MSETGIEPGLPFEKIRNRKLILKLVKCCRKVTGKMQ